MADAVQIRRAGHRTEHAFGRRPPKGEADGAGYGEMRRKVRVCAMHFRAVSGEVTQAAGAVHGRIMQLVGRGVDKGPAVCLQYCVLTSSPLDGASGSSASSARSRASFCV